MDTPTDNLSPGSNDSGQNLTSITTPDLPVFANRHNGVYDEVGPESSKEPNQLEEAFNKLQRAIADLDDAAKRLSDVVHLLSSTVYLREAAHDVRRSLAKLKAVPLKAFTVSLLIKLPDMDDVGETNTDWSDTEEYNWDQKSDGPYEAADDMYNYDSSEPEDASLLSSALMTMPPALCQLYQALCDLESYRFFANDYGTLLVLHDKFVILQKVIRRFGHQDKLHYYLVAYLNSITRCCGTCADGLKRFSDIGSEGIKTAQARVVMLHLNSATVATFLSGVTATTLQFTYMQTATRLGIAVNTLWIGSLALSIGSAMNSFLALAWRQSFFSSPGKAVSWWAAFWIRRGYLVLLIASCICFLAGLLCFTLMTQNMLTFWTLVGLTTILNLCILTVLAWFGRDKWVFSQHLQKQDRHWVTQLRERRRNRRIPPPKIFLRVRSRILASICFSSLYWQVQDIAYDFSLPIQSLGLIIKSGIQSVLSSRKKPSECQSDIEGGDEAMTFATVAAVALYSVQIKQQTRDRVHQLPHCYCEPSLALQFSPDGKWLVSISEKAVSIFSVKNEQIVRVQEHRIFWCIKDPKVVWSSNTSELAFSAVGIWRYCRNVWYLNALDFELKILTSENNTGRDPFRYVGQTLWSVPQQGELQSDFSWAFRNQKLVITTRLNYESSSELMYQLLDVDQRDGGNGLFFDSSTVQSTENHRKLGCCGEPTIFIVQFDVGKQDLQSRLSERTVYALAFCRSVRGKQLTFYVLLSGKIRDVAFNQKGHKDHTTSVCDAQASCHGEHEFLVSFASKPPQLWAFKHSNVSGAVKVTLTRSFAIVEQQTKKVRGTKWGVSSFVGINGEHVMTTVDDEVQIYNKDTGLLIRSDNVHCGRGVTQTTWALCENRYKMYAVASGSRITYRSELLEGVSASRTQYEERPKCEEGPEPSKKLRSRGISFTKGGKRERLWPERFLSREM